MIFSRVVDIYHPSSSYRNFDCNNNRIQYIWLEMILNFDPMAYLESSIGQAYYYKGTFTPKIQSDVSKSII